jgi:hypothetical protein
VCVAGSSDLSTANCKFSVDTIAKRPLQHLLTWDSAAPRLDPVTEALSVKTTSFCEINDLEACRSFLQLTR